MCTDKDRPPCEHDDLIGKVDRLQGQVARLTATNEGASQAARRSAASGQAPGSAFLQRRAGLKAEASRSKAGYGELQLPQAAVGGRTELNGATGGCDGG